MLKIRKKTMPCCSGWILFFLVPFLHHLGLLWLYSFKHEIYLAVGKLTSKSLVKALHARGRRVGMLIYLHENENHNKY